MNSDAVIAAMKALEFSDSQILAVVQKMNEQRRASSREANAERQRRFRERNGSNGITQVTAVTRDSVTEPAPYKDNHASAPANPGRNLTGSSHLEEKLKPSVLSKKSECLEILCECLSAETAEDLIAHRKAKKSPLTPGGAKRLVKDFLAFGDPEACAGAMMAQGWTGFKPEWMESQPRAGPRAPYKPLGNPAVRILAELEENDRRKQEFSDNDAIKRANGSHAGNFGFDDPFPVEAGGRKAGPILDLLAEPTFEAPTDFFGRAQK